MIEGLDRALIIQPEPLKKILFRGKMMELRSTRTTPGRIGLIESGSQLLVAAVDIIECIDLSDFKTFVSYQPMHLVEDERLAAVFEKYAWGYRLGNLDHFPEPLTVPVKRGCVTWVRL